VGSAVAHALLDRAESVVALTRDARRAEPFTRRGASAVVVDVRDSAALRHVLQRGTTAFLLMPPADPATDTVAEERQSVAAIAAAVEGTSVQKVVLQSTYGAQAGEGLGDLGVLYEFEQCVIATGVRASIIRAAYYMSNWDMALGTARDRGEMHTFFPADFRLPMVAPRDIGPIAAGLLTDDASQAGVRYVEGPQSYSPRDVAREFAAALGRAVRLVEIPRARWIERYRSLGFSEPAAVSYARMTAATVDGLDLPQEVERGSTTLREYVSALVGGGR
jgi:uncharacterized protein YbjT (DUF2867 family)